MKYEVKQTRTLQVYCFFSIKSNQKLVLYRKKNSQKELKEKQWRSCKTTKTQKEKIKNDMIKIRSIYSSSTKNQEQQTLPFPIIKIREKEKVERLRRIKKYIVNDIMKEQKAKIPTIHNKEYSRKKMQESNVCDLYFINFINVYQTDYIAAAETKNKKEIDTNLSASHSSTRKKKRRPDFDNQNLLQPKISSFFP